MLIEVTERINKLGWVLPNPHKLDYEDTGWVTTTHMTYARGLLQYSGRVEVQDYVANHTDKLGLQDSQLASSPFQKNWTALG